MIFCHFGLWLGLGLVLVLGLRLELGAVYTMHGHVYLSVLCQGIDWVSEMIYFVLSGT